MKARHALLLVASLAACAQPAAESSEPDLAVPDAVEIDDYPADADALYAEFAPLPGGPMAVDYDVEGPGGMKGTMTVIVAEGARRAESWALDMPMPDGETMQIAGSSIQTAAMSWTDAAEGSAETVSLPLGRIGKAFFELDRDTQHAVINHVRTWHREVARGREAHPGAVDSVAGQPCLRTRTAGQTLCVWETTGLPLEYRSEAFAVVATSVRVGVTVEDDTFAIPAGAPLKTDALQTFDVDASLRTLASGNLAELPGLLQPRLRVPG